MTNRKSNPMTADALASYMARYNMNCAELATRVEVEPDEVWRWLGEREPIPERVTRHLRRMDASRTQLELHARARADV